MYASEQTAGPRARIAAVVPGDKALYGYDSPSGAVEPLRRQEKERVTCDGS
jgi:hypothetical protein